MKIAIMQPYLFPYLGYFQLMAAVDRFVVFDDVNFIKKGWINRNRILVNQKEHLFTLPLRNASQNLHINQIEIVMDDKWRDDFIKTLHRSYKKAPFFIQTMNLVNSTFSFTDKNLSKFIVNSLKLIKVYAGITADIVESSAIYNNSQLHGQERIIDICKKEKADTYVNPPGGAELYDRSVFRLSGIELKFLLPQLDPYRQFTDEIIKGLSIIDVMMFNSAESLRAMVNNGCLS
jgi:hypothetical protein